MGGQKNVAKSGDHATDHRESSEDKLGAFRQIEK